MSVNDAEVEKPWGGAFSRKMKNTLGSAAFPCLPQSPPEILTYT